MWLIVAGVVTVVVSLGGMAVWMWMLLWAAREDGRDQKAYDALHGRPDSGSDG